MVFLRELRVAARVLSRQPIYSCSAIGVMTLAVAAVTGVFSVLHGVLLSARVDPMLAMRAE